MPIISPWSSPLDLLALLHSLSLAIEMMRNIMAQYDWMFDEGASREGEQASYLLRSIVGAESQHHFVKSHPR